MNDVVLQLYYPVTGVEYADFIIMPNTSPELRERMVYHLGESAVSHALYISGLARFDETVLLRRSLMTDFLCASFLWDDLPAWTTESPDEVDEYISHENKIRRYLMAQLLMDITNLNDFWPEVGTPARLPRWRREDGSSDF